jgi:hypothetical protein
MSDAIIYASTGRGFLSPGSVQKSVSTRFRQRRKHFCSGASLEVGGHFKGHDAGRQTQIDTRGRDALRSRRIHHD